MAIEFGWTGFESGEFDACPLVPGRGAAIGVKATYPRTGQFCLSMIAGDAPTNVWTSYRRKNLTLGGLGTPLATTIARVFFRLNGNMGSDGAAAFQCGTLSTAGQRGALIVNISRNFRAFAGNANGPLSGAVLDLGVWYRADLTHTVADNGTSVDVTTSISVYTEGGVLIETVSHAVTMALATPELPSDVACGNGTATPSNFDYDFDDLWWGSADGGDIATLAFPVAATRVTRVPATAQGTSAQWTGDFRTITDFPRETTTDEQSNAVAGQQTTFTHPTAASLGISGIEGVIVRAQLRSITSSGNEELLLGGVAYTVPVTTAFGNLGQNGVNYALVDQPTFNSWEFGARNVRGTGLRLATCYLEVLHAGSSQPAPYTDVSDTFRLNIITHFGNGSYQTIGGMGFGAQALIILPVSSALGAAGGLKLARHGGSQMQWFIAGSGRFTNGVLSLTDDGYVLGPSNNVNASGVQYLAIGIRDGGQGVGGFYLSTLSRTGSSLDNTSVIFKEPFTPDLAINLPGQSGAPIIRTSAMVGDVSIQWPGGTAVANFIQAMEATGFQVGSASVANGMSLQHHGLVMRIGTQLSLILHVGTLTPGGSSATITGIPFSPIFVSCQRQGNSASAQWRSSLTHGGANSTVWAGETQIATGITSITADGFTIGSSLATAGTPVHWFALAPGFVPFPVPPGCVDDWGIPRADDLPYVPLMPGETQNEHQ